MISNYNYLQKTLIKTHSIIAANTCTDNPKQNLLDMNQQQLRDFFITLKEKPFRADQVMKWIYHYCCDNFDQMTDIQQSLREKLKVQAIIHAPEIIREQRSSDGTIKWAMKIDHQQIVETVYIPEDNRATLCISSQVGCALQCTFCSTAQQGFNRNLRVFEIIGQVWRAIKIIKIDKINSYRPISNIVMMGMGEPLLNLNNVVSAIKIMLHDFGFGLSKHKVTLSTAGVAPALEKLGNMIDVSLAISLHAPNDMIRDQIMPINRKYNIETCLSAVHCYLNKSKANQSRVTVEYVMLDHINDDITHAHQLAQCLKNTPCKINLIPWNIFPNAPYQCSPKTQVDRFAQILKNHGFITIVRKIRGNDINAACGQLVGKIINRTRYSTHHQINDTST